MNQYKERNPSYMMDLDFANIKTLTYQTEPFRGGLSHKPYKGNNYQEAKVGGSLFLSLMVQMDMPCTARKRVSAKNKKEWVSQSRSPFNMGLNEIYLNNWNLNQTFIFKGRSSKEYLDRFIAIVKQRSPRAKVIEGEIEQIKPGKDYCLAHLKDLKSRSMRFIHELDKLRIQLRYSFMALLSENKVNLFNDSIITLMQLFVGKEWNSDDKYADFGSFLLDKMHMKLDPVKMPYHDLVEVFKASITEEHKEEFEESRNGLNFLR